MDGMLREEERCFSAMSGGLDDLAGAVWPRVADTFRVGGRYAVEVSLDQLLPSWPELESAVMPHVGNLLATARERSLVVARRHLRACESSISQELGGIAQAAMKAATPEVATLERGWFDRASGGAMKGAFATVSAMRNQAGLWAGRGEPLELLRQRWYDAEVVRLPGSEPRGAVWMFRVWMNGEARNASVGLTNALLLAAMGAWNRVAAQPA
jgi:hypothetical protein